MRIPDKLPKDSFADLIKKGKKSYILVGNDETGKQKLYEIPKWFQEVIEFEVEMSKESGKNSAISAIRQALHIR